MSETKLIRKLREKIRKALRLLDDADYSFRAVDPKINEAREVLRKRL